MGAVAMALFNPCKPPLLGSYLLCSTSALGSLSNYWIPVIASLEFFVCMQSVLRGAHQVVFSLLALIAEFWGNCTQFLNQPRTENVRKTLLRYRELQISEKIINSTFRATVFLPLLCALPLIQIFAGVAFVTLFHTAGWLSLLIFWIAWQEAVFVGVISMSAGSVIYTRTYDWILGKRGKDGRRAYGSKVVKSYRPLRLEFGSNFIDRLTALVMQEFCVRNTASLLLLQGLGKYNNN